MASASIELLRDLDISFREWSNYCSTSVVALQQPMNHYEIIAGAIQLQHNTCPFRIWVSIKSLFCIRLQSVTSLWIVEYQYTLIDYLCHIYIYIYISNYAEIVYVLSLLHNNTARETFLHKCEVSTGYLSLGRRSGGDWANKWQWTKRLRIFFLNKK